MLKYLYMKHLLTLTLVLITGLFLAACSPAEELENAATDAVQQQVDGLIGGGEGGGEGESESEDGGDTAEDGDGEDGDEE